MRAADDVLGRIGRAKDPIRFEIALGSPASAAPSADLGHTLKCSANPVSICLFADDVAENPETRARARVTLGRVVLFDPAVLQNSVLASEAEAAKRHRWLDFLEVGTNGFLGRLR